MTVLAFTVQPEVLVIGALTGLAYSLLAAGLVLVYRGSKVINFAHGEIGAFAALILARLVLQHGWPFVPALLVALLVGGLVGAVVELGVVRRLHDQPRLILLVATIGVSQLLFLAQLLFPGGVGIQQFPTLLDRQLQLGGLLLRGEHFTVLAVVPAVVVMLGVFLTRTPWGIAIRASAENPEAAELAAISPKRVSTMVWVLAGTLAALTVILINPVRGTLVGTPTEALGPGLLVRALAAALVGRLVSLPRALVGGIAVGVLEALLFANVDNTGFADAALLVIVLAALLIGRPDLASGEGTGFTRIPRPTAMPAVLATTWLGRHGRHLALGLSLGAAALLPVLFGRPDQVFLFSRMLVYGIAAISLTLLVGWAGQLSLGHFAFVGLGSMVVGALVLRGMGFWSAAAFAVVAGMFAGVLVGAPALRLRGLFLSVTTLAFAGAASGWLFSLPALRGPGSAVTVPRPTLLGIDTAPQRVWYYVCLAALVAVSAMVVHLRRTGMGRSIIAVRENEQRSASLTISPAFIKLVAFGLSAAVAALAGALLAGLRVQFSPDAFGPRLSLDLVAIVIIGGVGRVPGALLGTLWVVGLPAFLGDSLEISLLTSGAGLLALVMYLPGGLLAAWYRVRGAALDALAGRVTRRTTAVEATPAQDGEDAADDAPAAPVVPLPPPGEAPGWPAPAGSPEEDPADTPTVELPPLPATLAAITVGTPPEPAPEPEPEPEVVARAHGVCVDLGGRRILTDVDLHALRGETVGLIGSNGAGKSTLMNALSGFLPIAEGRAEVLGHDVTRLPAHERARIGMGRIFQDARLFGDLTVRESILVALEARERSEVLPSLLALPPSRRAERGKAAEVGEIIDFLGLGRYADTLIASLSTGSRRIVELGCLVAQRAELLLLDEPTAGVAQREAEAFGPLVTAIRDELGATVVMIEHDIPLVSAMSDRVYCMSTGTVIAEGLPEQVRRDPAVIAAYLGTDERAIDRSDASAGTPPARPRLSIAGGTAT